MRAVLAAALLLSGCVPGGEAGPVVGKEAPPYAAVTLAGDSVSLASLRGRAILLNFWATWCAPCRHETPFLQALWEARKDEGLVIVGASLDTRDARDQVRSFVEEYGVTYPILLDPQMRGMDAYRVLGLPATFLLDRDGILRWMRFGPVSETDLDFLSALESILE